MEAYKAAVATKDVDAFVGLYHPKVRIFDSWMKWSYEGLVAWKQMVTQWFDSLGTDHDVVRFDDTQIHLGDDLAIVHTFIRFTAVSPEGKELRSMNERLTWTLKNEGGSWSILHQHTSVPINFETMTAILQR
jgi:uncharacterized protein (TIGR02246 family)